MDPNLIRHATLGLQTPNAYLTIDSFRANKLLSQISAHPMNLPLLIHLRTEKVYRVHKDRSSLYVLAL